MPPRPKAESVVLKVGPPARVAGCHHSRSRQSVGFLSLRAYGKRTFSTAAPRFSTHVRPSLLERSLTPRGSSTCFCTPPARSPPLLPAQREAS